MYDSNNNSNNNDNDSNDNDNVYTRSPSQDFRLFGPRPWKILATTYDKNNDF